MTASVSHDPMQKRACLSVVLAAGEGTRMRSAYPKVLHAIGGAPLIAHVLNSVRGISERVAVVIAPGEASVAARIKEDAPGADIFVQDKPRGTAHAVLAARSAITGRDDVIVLFGDTPLITGATLGRLRASVGNGTAVAVLGFRAKDPTGYGRLIVDQGKLLAIREEKDATAAERAINLCNAGVMAFDGSCILTILDRIRDHNAKGEFYLTDAVAIARDLGFSAAALETEEDEVRGINTRAQLAEAEATLQQRLRKKWLDAGVTMVAPETVFLSADTELARDVVIEPHVVFGEGVTVDEGAVVHSFSHLVGSHIGPRASVGPFARLRPGTRLGADARIGNFVEVKAAEIEQGAKANHLSYIGDARVGAGANVGAGTITCNYDGTSKHRTDIGKGAFIGSNSALVAPVSIGDGAYVGSGSVITRDVPADALAVARGQQTIKEGWARRRREEKPSTVKKKAHAPDQ
jgi:bifunctional UDP-N-acetylglucosamine pyrophosphorylase/glucosamine-1-phosphate N-acetyltransferase